MNSKISVKKNILAYIQNRIAGLEYDLSNNNTSNDIKRYKKTVFKRKMLLKTIEKGIYNLRFLIKNPEFRKDHETDSYIMKRINILNEEASRLNREIVGYSKIIKNTLELHNPTTLQEKLDILQAEKVQIEAEIAYLESNLWDDRQLGADEKYVEIASEEEHKAVRAALDSDPYLDHILDKSDNQ